MSGLGLSGIGAGYGSPLAADFLAGQRDIPLSWETQRKSRFYGPDWENIYPHFLPVSNFLIFLKYGLKKLVAVAKTIPLRILELAV